MTDRWLINGATLLLFAAAIWLLWPRAEPVPPVTFNLTSGETLNSTDLLGKPLLVSFWSVSCEVCLRDMPRLTRLQETLREQGLVVIGVAMPHDPPPAVIETIERLRPGYRIAFDVHGEISRAFGDIKVTPSTFLIDRNGNIRLAEQGPLDEIRVRATLATL